jgi:putative membrane protein
MASAHDSGNSSADLLSDDQSVELASNRTAMSFERTAMASDRTLMSVLRTSLSLIGFGFTIFSFFHSLSDEFARIPGGAMQRFSLVLVALGIVLLALGIFNHVRETRARRLRRARLCRAQLIRHIEPVRLSSAMAIAILLFVAGLFAILRIGFALGPF